ncbi:g12835 [Coccomyxa viridis]|uniref:G12835 protein n=1 Tax=Coccomyxa viridis TaxID=1274662 RepID=A0ABP1GBE9_9CHLO
MLTKFLRPFHLKLFYSGKHIHASIISKIENKIIISTSSNNRLYRETLGEYAPKNDQTASEAVAKVLLDKLKKKKVASLFWDGHLVFKTTRKKFEQRADHLWHTLEQAAPAYNLRLEREAKADATEKVEEGADRQPVNESALLKPSPLDPEFRREMWDLLSIRDKQRRAVPPQKVPKR